MIEINAFWFGYFLGMLTVVVLFVVLGFISARVNREEEPEIDESDLPPELQEAILEAIKKREEDKRNGV